MKRRGQEGLIAETDARREAATSRLGRERQSRLGQFFTPAPVAHLAAQMLKDLPYGDCVRLLDPGAGVGSLTAGAVTTLVAMGRTRIEVVAYEVDRALHPALRETLQACSKWARANGGAVAWELRGEDYISDTAAGGQLGHEAELFEAIIMNPPYRKIGSGSDERRALEPLGLRVPNLYTAFLALAVDQLVPGGVVAAITPRSFASGLYYEPFRQYFFSRVQPERIHIFELRDEVFADSSVLQENIILSARRGEAARHVHVSVSRGAADEPVTLRVPLEEVVSPRDPSYLLRIPTREDDAHVAKSMADLPADLSAVNISVSTGRVVEFRAREYLRPEPAEGTVPLLHPTHLRAGSVDWPGRKVGRRPNALVRAPETEALLLPNEPYVLIKRFTAKEERRRVVAAVLEPDVLPGTAIAVENHINVFHRHCQGLPIDIAYGLSVYLNSRFVDRYVRLVNGHTQINATDLRNLRYPSLTQLAELGAAMRDDATEAEGEHDALLERIIPGLGTETPSDTDRVRAVEGHAA